MNEWQDPSREPKGATSVDLNGGEVTRNSAVHGRSRRFALGSAAVAVLTLATACSSSGGGAAAGASGSSAGGSSSAPVNVTISYSEKTGDEIALWIAHDAGLFKKEGLNVTLQYLASNAGVPALLSNQVEIASLGGSQILSAVAQGTDMKYILTLSPVSTFQLWAQKQYASASGLKGRRIGITKTTGSQYIGTVTALKELGLAPSDVQIVSLGSVPNVDSAMIAGTIAAAASHPPSTVEYQKKGYVDVVDLAQKQIPAANTGYAVLTKYAKSDSAVIQKVVNATLKALQREKSDKAYTEQIMKKYMGVTDQDQLDATYEFYAHEVAPSVPLPAVNQFTDSKKAIGKSNAKVAAMDLSSFIDASYVNKAAKSLGISASSSPSN